MNSGKYQNLIPFPNLWNDGDEDLNAKTVNILANVIL